MLLQGEAGRSAVRAWRDDNGEDAPLRLRPELRQPPAGEEVGDERGDEHGLSRPAQARDAEPDRRLEQHFRRAVPRFSEANYPRNREIIDGFKDFARERGQSVAGLAMAWVLAQGDHLIPIPGTRTAEHLHDWVDADTISLTPEDMAEIARLLPVGFAHGDRYSDTQMQTIERYC